MPEASARAYLRDLPNAELHLLDGGHWLLETNLSEVASPDAGLPFARRHQSVVVALASRPCSGIPIWEARPYGCRGRISRPVGSISSMDS